MSFDLFKGTNINKENHKPSAVTNIIKRLLPYITDNTKKPVRLENKPVNVYNLRAHYMSVSNETSMRSFCHDSNCSYKHRSFYDVLKSKAFIVETHNIFIYD